MYKLATLSQDGALCRNFVQLSPKSALEKNGVYATKPRFLNFDNTHTILRATGHNRDSVVKKYIPMARAQVSKW